MPPIVRKLKISDNFDRTRHPNTAFNKYNVSGFLNLQQVKLDQTQFAAPRSIFPDNRNTPFDTFLENQLSQLARQVYNFCQHLL